MIGDTVKGRAAYRDVPAEPLAKTIPLPHLQQKTAEALAQSEAPSLLGHSRYKYFQRPVVPFLHAVPPDLLAPSSDASQPLAATLTRASAANANGNAANDSKDAVDGAKKTVGVQTMYRESEAQTAPWSPEFDVDPNEEPPEVLMLQHLTYGKGLPASMEEVNLIHKLREKRAFEKSLPEITDEASFQLRKKMLEERELKEWEAREEEMRKEQDERLGVLMANLRARDEKQQELVAARVDKIRQSKIGDRDISFDNIHRHRIKVHRGLGKSRAATLEEKEPRRDIVGEHANFASTVYAPITREGRLPVKNQVAEYSIPLISNFRGLESLEKGLPGAVIDLRVEKPRRVIPRSYSSRKDEQVAAHLANVDRHLALSKTERFTPLTENVYKKFEPVLRAATPVVQAPEDEERERAVLLLQRLIRGRAVQNTMFAGKQHTKQLIKELRIAEDPPAEAQVDEEAASRHAHDSIQGEVVSNALDFISKEIVRVAEERKVAKLVSLASKTRRVREAEESGRRQAEDLLRRKREQHYHAVMSVHSATADRFLDEIFAGAITVTATAKAADQAAIKARVLDTVVQNVEAKLDTSQVVVHDLVSSFLLPEVERRSDVGHHDITHRSYIDAAHHASLAAIHDVQSVMMSHSS